MTAVDSRTRGGSAGGPMLVGAHTRRREPARPPASGSPRPIRTRSRSRPGAKSSGGSRRCVRCGRCCARSTTPRWRRSRSMPPTGSRSVRSTATTRCSARVLAPADRVSALAYAQVEQAVLINVPAGVDGRRADRRAHPRRTVADRPPATSSSTSRPAPRRRSIFDSTGSATLAGNVELRVGDGAIAVDRVRRRLGARRDRGERARRADRARRDAAAHRRQPRWVDSCGLSPSVSFAGPGGRAELDGVCFAGAEPASRGSPLRRPQPARLHVRRALQERAGRAGGPHGLDRRRAHPAAGDQHPHLRDEPQPGALRRCARRLGPESRDRDRRDPRRRPRERDRAIRRPAAVLPAVARHPRGRGPPAGRPGLLRRRDQSHRGARSPAAADDLDRGPARSPASTSIWSPASEHLDHPRPARQRRGRPGP